MLRRRAQGPERLQGRSGHELRGNVDRRLSGQCLEAGEEGQLHRDGRHAPAPCRQRRAEADAAKDRAKEAAINARAATRATEAKPADLVRTRTETGTMATAKSWWDFEITDARELDLESLRPFIPKAALEQALRGFIAAGGREIAGARIFEETKAVFR